MDVASDGKYLVVGSNDDNVNLYNLVRGEKINTYSCKKYGVSCVKFTHHFKCILSASWKDNQFRV